MDKNPQTSTDYAAILADMEAKKIALESAITGMRAALALGALGVSSEGVAGSSATAGAGQSSVGGAVALPRGAFLGRNAPEAIKLYLSAVRRKQTNKEIAQALRDGGLESTGNFDNYITSGLFRLKNEGAVLRFDDGWGLTEWYPESFRMRVAEKAVNVGKRKTKQKGVRKAKAPEDKNNSGIPKPKMESLDQRIAVLLLGEPSRVLTVQEIAKALDVRAGSLTLSLSRLAAKGKALKLPGGYQTAPGNVQEMPPSAKAS